MTLLCWFGAQILEEQIIFGLNLVLVYMGMRHQKKQTKQNLEALYGTL